MDDSRRDFILKAGAGAAIAAVGSSAVFGTAAAKTKNDPGLYANHKLPPLPYDYGALEPYLDERTLTIHHDRHHAGYVKGLNNAETKLQYAQKNGDFDMIDYWSQKFAFHGAGHNLHSLYWLSMSPNGGKAPGGALGDKIANDFGSYDTLKANLHAASKSVEGSGWGMVALRPEDGRIVVLQIENHQKFTPWNVVPLLVVDVWEHAYYLKYQNMRGSYLDAFFEVVDWTNASKIYEESFK